MLRAIEAVAPSLSVKLLPISIRDHIERSLDAFGREPNGGLIVLPNPLAEENKDLIARVAVRNRLPSIYVFRFYVAAGGLMSYGVDTAEQPRQAASYVDRILRGEKPLRLASAATDEVRACNQSQDRQGTRVDHFLCAARARRRGDRVITSL